MASVPTRSCTVSALPKLAVLPCHFSGLLVTGYVLGFLSSLHGAGGIVRIVAITHRTV